MLRRIELRPRRSPRICTGSETKQTADFRRLTLEGAGPMFVHNRVGLEPVVIGNRRRKTRAKWGRSCRGLGGRGLRSNGRRTVSGGSLTAMQATFVSCFVRRMKLSDILRSDIKSVTSD